MNFISQVVQYLTTWSNWTGAGYSSGIFTQLAEQLELTALALAVAVITGVGLGAVLGHSGKGSFAFVNAANAARAVPSIALLTLLAIQPTFADMQEGGLVVAVITMWALAVPPILTNSYVGVREVDGSVRSAALAMGMKRHQVLWKVELPLALPLIMAGVRTAAVEVVATATLAAYVGINDLGQILFSALQQQQGPQLFSGALLIGALALLVDQSLAWVGRVVAPNRQRRDRGRRQRPLKVTPAQLAPVGAPE